MNPSAGNFLTMDTYEGDIYNPDPLHKYMHANENPVTCSDSSGNFSAVTMAAGMAINDTITAVYNIYLMGLAGISNMDGHLQQRLLKNGYIYVVQTDNYIDINANYGLNAYFSEQMEFSIPGGIKLPEIIQYILTARWKNCRSFYT